MASGTQGYQKTTTDKSLADTLISEYKKLRKRSKSGGSENPIDPANLKFVQDSVQAVDDFIVSGINGITSMFSTSASPVDAYDPVSYDDGTAIDVEVVTENKKQTALLEAQNALLGQFIEIKRDQIADAKRLRQEERMEDEEFLSGTQGYRGAIEKKGGEGGGILSKLSDIVQIVVGAKAALLALKAAIPAALKTALAGAMAKFVGVFKGLKLGAAFKGTKNFFGNMFKNKNVAAKDAVVNQKGNIVNPNRSIDNLKKINVEDDLLSKNLKNKNLQLKQSNLQKVDIGSSKSTVQKEVLEEIVLDNTGSGKNISKSIKSANTNLGGGPGVIDDVVTAGAGTADDAASSIVNQITSKPAVKPKFNIKTFLNPRTINWKNMFKGGVVGIVTGMITGKINDALANWEASSIANGISRKDIEGQKAEILRLKEEILKEEDWKKNPLFRLQQLWGILEAVVSMGGKSPLQIGDEKIRMNEMILDKLKNKGIDIDAVTVDGGVTNNNEEINNTEVNGDENLSSNSNAFSTENILGSQGVEVASTDLTGVLGDTNTVSKVNGQNFFQTSNSTTTGNLKGLTEDDYKWLAYAISGEAAQGTDDIYGVAASILNRKARGDGSIEEIIKAPGQYKAFEDGNMVDSPEIQSLLQSEEGQAKLMEALRVLKGRTDFKGQSALSNRVATEDPMFDEKGNFFHHSWQTSGDSVKPEGWKPVNWQQYIPGEGIEGAQGLNNKLSQQVAGLSSETSGSPTFVFIPSPSGSNNNAGSNEGATSMNFAQLPTKNDQLSIYAQQSLQALNA